MRLDDILFTDGRLAAEISDEQQMYSMAGYGSLMRLAQLSEVLFTKLQYNCGHKKGKTGYSTGQKELDKLHEQHPYYRVD